MKKIIVKLDFHDDNDKRKAIKAVSALPGIDEISVNIKEHKLTVVGAVDPVDVVEKLKKKHWHPVIVSVGPAKEEKKKEEPKKEEKKDEPAKKKDVNEQIAELVKAYQDYKPHLTTQYIVHSAEENPNACVIC